MLRLLEVGESTLDKLAVLSRRQAVRYRGDVPYVVVSIRSPSESIPKLQADPLRAARINLAIYDTTPEWEAVSSEPVAVMTIDNAQRIARFVARYWGRYKIVVHCRLGVSRSAGIAAGILDVLSHDVNRYERPPYEPNLHCRHLVRRALAQHIASM
jgi:predicted protein tyrosine phosphatase